MPAFYWIKKILFVMNRKLLFLERFIYGDGTLPKNITFTVKMLGTFTMNHLQHALAKVQAKHPALRARVVVDDKGMHWFVNTPRPAPVPIRFTERCGDEGWLQESEAECAQPFNTNGPLMRVVWMHSPGVSDLMLVCHHCICDGASVITLLREILQLLDQPDTDIGRYEAFSSIQDLLPAEVLADRKIRRQAKFIRYAVRLYAAFFASRKKIPWGKDYTIRWRLSKAETAALTQQCQEEEVTMHAALCVALVMAFRHVKGPQAGSRVFCPVNIRRYLRSIKPDMLLGFATSITLSLDNDPQLDLASRIRLLNNNLTDQLTGMNVYKKLMTSEYQHPLVKTLEKCIRNAKGNHALTFSNLGRLDVPKRYENFEVAAIHNPITVFRSANPNGIVASTFDGQLGFSLLSNDAYLSQADAAAIRDKAMEILFNTWMSAPRAALTNTL